MSANGLRQRKRGLKMKHTKHFWGRLRENSETGHTGKRVWLPIVIVLVTGILIGAAYSCFQVKTQLERADALKSELFQTGQRLLAGDTDGAWQAVNTLDELVDQTQQSLESPFWRLAEKVPVLGKNVTTASQALSVLDKASTELLRPTVGQLQSYPLTGITSSPELIERTARSYMAFFLDRLPSAQRILSLANELELEPLDKDGKLRALLAMAQWGIQVAQTGADQVVVPLLEMTQRYPVSQWDMEMLANPDFVDGYSTILEKSIPILEETLTELGENGAASVDRLSTPWQVLEVLRGISERLLQPLREQLYAYPLSAIKVEDGFYAAVVARYIVFAEEIMPDAEGILAQIQALPLDFLHTNETVVHKLLVANNLVALYHQSGDILSFAKAFLAEGQDRTYLLVAQNSAETRASGGFPGSMGVIRIRDGVLTVGDFAGVNDTLTAYAPMEGNFTQEEYHLFQHAIRICRDACFCPDFERVAEIWALGYESKNGHALDGIISVTPAIIQKIMSPGEKLVLSDGTELTSENATRVLQRDLYFRYFTPAAVIEYANAKVDALFAETAKEAMNQLISGMEARKMLRLLEVMREGFADRTLMVWMSREEEQTMLRDYGWSGGLNTDPNQPQAGIYFSNTPACKMGWFLEIDTEIGEPVVNGDGSRTYPITVRLSNIITEQEIQSANAKYILGGDGRIIGAMHFFAPAGGSVDHFVSPNWVEPYRYNGHTLGYLDSITILPGQTQTITYEVTTAPGVDAPLSISQTPTLQEYHGAPENGG